MTQPIDTAYVDIVARGEDDAAREIAKALNKIAAEVKKLTESIEKEFAQAGRDMESEVQQATKSIERDLDRQSRAAKKTGTSLALAMKEASESAAHSIDTLADEATRDLGRIEHAAERAAVAVAIAGKNPSGGGGGGGGINVPGRGGSDYIGRHRDIDRVTGALGGLASLASTATRAVSELAEALGNRLANAGRQTAQTLGVLAGSISAALGPIGSAIAGLGLLGAALLLTPLIIPLAAALTQLTGLFGLMPGAIGVLVASIAPLMIAFSGIGAAVTALASGDLEKIDKAMQNLAPNARKFAVELFKIKDRLKVIKSVVQTEFFANFNGSLTKLVDRLLPTLTSGLGDVADALGTMGARLSATFGDTAAIEAFQSIFASAQKAINGLTSPLSNAFTAVFQAIKAAQPFIDRMFASLAGGIQKFADWLSRAVEDGRFQKWLEDAFTVANKLWGLLKSVGRLIGAVFSDTADDGKDFLDTLTEIVDKWTVWFESPEGKKARDDAIQTMKDLVDAIKTLSGWLVTVGQWGQRIKDFFGGIPGAIGDAASAIGGFFSDLWDDVKGAGAAVGEWFGSVGRWFEEAGQTVADQGGEVLQWFQDLPGKVGDWLAELPEKISSFFETSSDRILYWIGYAFGFVVSETMALPDRIAEGLTTLWNTFTEWFTRTRDDITELVTQTWDNVTEWFDKLPGRVGDALSDMWDNVTEWFSRTRRSATDSASGAVDSVVGWFEKLPGRATSAIRKLPGQIRDILRGIVTDAGNIGRDIMHGIADGIRNGWNSAINAAQDAARQVLRGFWDAFDINSPSKLMIREVGMPIMEGVGVGIEKGMSPLSTIIKSSTARMMSEIQRAISPVETTGHAFAVDLLAALKNPTGSDRNLAPNSAQEDFSWSGMSAQWTDEIRSALVDQLGLNFWDSADAQRRIESYLSQTPSQVPSQVPSQAPSQAPAISGVGGAGSGSGIVIQNLTIPIQGIWDMTDPTAARRLAHNIYEALENLKRDYR